MRDRLDRGRLLVQFTLYQIDRHFKRIDPPLGQRDLGLVFSGFSLDPNVLITSRSLCKVESICRLASSNSFLYSIVDHPRGVEGVSVSAG